jgi:hypothetical protein
MPRPYLPVRKRRTVIARANGYCEYCQSRADYATETFAVEHIIPISLGGTDDLENLALSCSGCNNYKHDKIEAIDPVDGVLTPLFDPRRQRWRDHFTWSDDYCRIVGLTAIGRTTIATLQMNRLGLVNLRYALYLIRKHPPERIN